ncbi:MAG: hypothetical protein HQ483_14945 [Rhodospirillales bacterium]|nr:hypothetical protein [Rhodospirillales bacterium]
MRCLILLILAASVALPAAAQTNPRPFATFDKAGPAVLNDPHDLAFGPDGRLYVADKFNSRITVLDPDSMDIVGSIGDGQLYGVHDISFGPSGRAAVAVTGLGVVLVFDDITAANPQPRLVLPASQTEGALMHSNGNIYAMAGGIGALLAYSPTGELIGNAGNHVGAHDVAEDADGNIWVADNFNARLVQYAPDLTELQVLDHEKYGFIGPRYLDVDRYGRLVVADQDGHRVMMINPKAPDGGRLIGVLGNGLPGMGPGLFDDPEGVVARDNRYYISDSDNNRIVRYVVVIN